MVERSERLSQLTESFFSKNKYTCQGTFNPKMSHGSGGKLAKLMSFGRNRKIS